MCYVISAVKRLACTTEICTWEYIDIEAEAKWPPFCRRYFQVQFPDWNVHWLIYIYGAFSVKLPCSTQQKMGPGEWFKLWETCRSSVYGWCEKKNVRTTEKYGGMIKCLYVIMFKIVNIVQVTLPLFLVCLLFIERLAWINNVLDMDMTYQWYKKKR